MRDLNPNAYASASTFLTVSTNIIVTTLITIRLSRARRTLSKLLPSRNMQLYTGVVAILIESALPLSIFGIVAAVLMQLAVVPRPNPSEAELACYGLFTGLFYAFCTLSPHMIIFRVTTGRSFTQFPSVKNGILSNPIVFAHQTAESSLLQPSFNHELGINPGPDAEQGVPSTTQTSIIDTTEEKRGNGDVENKI
ncbi:hypothetical protein H1R20_g1623, partial [Candolleomyces eurysporus]